MERICRYLQCTKKNVLVFNPSKKLVVDCYADANFAGLWGHEDPQDPICDISRTGFVVTTVYEYNNKAIVVATSLRMTDSSKHIAVNYDWFRQHSGKEFVIQKIESENQKADIFTKGLQGQIFARIRKFLCSW